MGAISVGQSTSYVTTTAIVGAYDSTSKVLLTDHGGPTDGIVHLVRIQPSLLKTHWTLRMESVANTGKPIELSPLSNRAKLFTSNSYYANTAERVQSDL